MTRRQQLALDGFELLEHSLGCQYRTETWERPGDGAVEVLLEDYRTMPAITRTRQRRFTEAPYRVQRRRAEKDQEA